MAAATGSARSQITLPGPGFINTVAGTGTAGFSGDGGLASGAKLDNPYGLAVDSAGNIYVADSGNSVIRKITASTGKISTVAGQGLAPGFADGPATTTAKLNGPASVALDSEGNIYIADYVNNSLRVVNTTGGTITIAGTSINAGYVGTVAGNGTPNESGNGPASSSELDGPTGVAVDAAGNIYIADKGGARIRAINPNATGTVTIATISIPAGYINTIAGGTTDCSGKTDGIGDGCPATQAQMGSPTGVALDSSGNIYIADPSGDHYDVRKVTASTGIISLFAGDGTGGYSGDGGPATSAELEAPNRVAVDAAGNVYIADSNSPSIRIRMVAGSTGSTYTAGYIYTVAGSGTACAPSTASCGDGGSATSTGADLNDPIGVAVDRYGNIYIGDSGDNRIRAVGSTLFEPIGSMNAARTQHTATLLQNGLVLITGGDNSNGFDTLASAELYNPATGAFTLTGSMRVARKFHTATLLPNGLVLVAGGDSGGISGELASAELYNPATGAFTLTGSMNVTRESFTATLLPSGLVLVAGGKAQLASAELYNPATGVFTPTGSMNAGRQDHTATLLTSGSCSGCVLVAGGDGLVAGGGGPLASAELYNPSTGAFTVTGSMATARTDHTATLLPGGLVLVAGGAGGGATAELYNPATGAFSSTGSMNVARKSFTATLLPSGLVLVAGGGVSLSSAELFNPATNVFAWTGSMSVPRTYQTATLLPNGFVLIAGGDRGPNTFDTWASAELY